MNRDPTVVLGQLAAPEDEDDELPPSDDRQDLDSICWRWAHWCRTRRLYLKPSLPPSILGRLTKRGTGRRGEAGGPDALAGAEMMAFHLAYLAQPEDALDRRVFSLHYYDAVRNVKAAAAAVGVSRRHWYRLVEDCRMRIWTASQTILQQNLAERDALPSVLRSGGTVLLRDDTAIVKREGETS